MKVSSIQMMNNKYEAETQVLYSFLHAVQGNWRNAIYIECSYCRYISGICSGYLLSADKDGAPILISISLFERLTGEIIDKTECIGKLRYEAFENLYHTWLVWHTDTEQPCSILRLLQDRKILNM